MAPHRRQRRGRARAQPGSPGLVGNPDSEETAAEYLRDSAPEAVPAAPIEPDDDPDDMATGTLHDQQIYEGLRENERKRSARVARAAPSRARRAAGNRRR
jgi:hypothetical protein